MVVLPTGTDKSAVISLAPYVLGSRRVLIITPAVTITKQIERDMLYVCQQFSSYTYKEVKFTGNDRLLVNLALKFLRNFRILSIQELMLN